MIFYKGSMSYETLQNMPIPELLRWQKYAAKINKERERAAKNGV
jgi:hypothetical protein